MRRNPARYVHADGRDFATVGMHAGQVLDPKCFYTKVTNCAYQYLFEITDEAMNIFAIRTEVDNWIANDLAQAVISDFAAAVSFEDSYTPRLQHSRRRDYPGPSRAAADRQGVRMLEQKQRIWLSTRQNCALGSFLNVERRAIVDAAQALDLQYSFHRSAENRRMKL